MQVAAVSFGREAFAVGDAERRRVARELELEAGFRVFFVVDCVGLVFAEARSEVPVERNAAREVQVYGGPLEEGFSAGLAVEEVSEERPPGFVFGTQGLGVVSQVEGFFLRDRDELVELVEQLVV